MMKSKYVLLILISFLVVTSSCRDHVDLEENHYNTAVQRLTKTFVERFGQPKGNHTWSTLGKVEISISLPEGDYPYNVDLFTSDPRITSPRSYRFAHFQKLEGGKTYEKTLEASAALTEIYIVVYDLVSGLCYINNVEKDSTGRFTAKVDEVNSPEPKTYYADMLYLLAFEDLGVAVDLDYNDFVLGIRYVAGKEELELSIMAMGTNLNVYAYLDGQELFEGNEIHNLLRIPNSVCMNVFCDKNVFTLDERSWSEFTSLRYPETVIKYRIPEDFSVELLAKSISIKTVSESSLVKDEEAKEIFFGRDLGKAPLAMLIADGNWEWPSEGISIGIAYPDFINWVTDQSHYNWY